MKIVVILAYVLCAALVGAAHIPRQLWLDGQTVIQVVRCRSDWQCRPNEYCSSQRYCKLKEIMFEPISRWFTEDDPCYPYICQEPLYTCQIKSGRCAERCPNGLCSSMITMCDLSDNICKPIECTDDF